jgi:L-rhamnose isomerase
VDHGLTVSSPDEETREFWIRHAICCRQIAERIGEELDDEVFSTSGSPTA